MTSKLREALSNIWVTDFSNDLGVSIDDDAIDAIIDAVIEALPETSVTSILTSLEEKYNIIGLPEHVIGYKAAIQDVRDILNEANGNHTPTSHTD